MNTTIDDRSAARTRSGTLGEAASADDREALRDSVADLLRRRGGMDSVRKASTLPGRTDEPLWSTLCTEIGVAALLIPERFDGAGASLAETAVVLEELGGSLSPVPAFSTALATVALLLARDDAVAAQILPGIASGGRTATVCWAGAAGWNSPGVIAEGGLLSGTAHYVVDGESADLFVVLADGPGHEPTLHVVAADADGVQVQALPTVDPTRPLATVSFSEAPAQGVASAADLPSRLQACAWALLACEQVGGAQAALDLSVEYAKVRKQFGRAIGSFQALKHRMADMYVLVESARSVARAAIEALVDDAPDAETLAASAHVYCSEAFSSVTGDAIQIHGGIGITWEHDIHLYFKRAQGSSQLFGQPHEALRRLLP
ncbi:acyl-CoA dehydrogenase family protein [Gordonia sp. (in: high G+C Gram-positive bacteria)]|jgi:alkylation response protein AidB-like acyl-CoA dehydrogenase|uniref:acyl-CoA dehydrogenase family protein n=2 Tax=Gordonia sp. (in: high G+C Gram-positive bacteria) TaxID=84139 RepID=UPI002602B5DD|nr:acyl-CoA dehydrogenase family protein [Gordonia sp. (in: high G+C Gram-positive bacteria)]HMS77625.1 acyl-CoA dehydrogenase family protein [Gordonia sp. (in: high G+C Gram-positive bacteria)]